MPARLVDVTAISAADFSPGADSSAFLRDAVICFFAER
jgi:hypothetical protein